MKSKTFLILVIVLCVLGVATYFVLDRENPASQTSVALGEKPFGELPLKDIATVRIASVEMGETRTVGLKNEGSGWTVTDRFGYPAEFKSISDLVEKFTESKIGRTFEANPDSISRMSLEPPDKQDTAEETKGVRIQLLAADEKPLADVIVGKERESSTGMGGQYLKPAAENTVYLVDQSFRFVSKKPEEWLKTDLLDIKADAVESVVCKTGGEQPVAYEAARPEKGKTPELKDPLEGRQLKPRSVTSLFDALSSLKIKDVAGISGEVPDDKTGFNALPHLEYRLYDGTIYRLYPGNKAEGVEEGYYLKVEVDYRNPKPAKTGETAEAAAAETPSETTPAVGEGAVPPKVEIVANEETAKAEVAEASDASGKTETSAKEEKSEDAKPEEEINPQELAYEAKTLNEKLSKWVYVVSDWERKSMTTDPEGFYEEKKEEAEPEEKTD